MHTLVIFYHHQDWEWGSRLPMHDSACMYCITINIIIKISHCVRHVSHSTKADIKEGGGQIKSLHAFQWPHQRKLDQDGRKKHPGTLHVSTSPDMIQEHITVRASCYMSSVFLPNLTGRGPKYDHIKYFSVMLSTNSGYVSWWIIQCSRTAFACVNSGYQALLSYYFERIGARLELYPVKSKTVTQTMLGIFCLVGFCSLSLL